MPFTYHSSPRGGALRQGEILRDVWEHRALTAGPDESPPLASVEHRLIGELPALVADFKKFLAFSVPGLYLAIQAGHIDRVALVPPVYVHDLMHRFFGFLSRVGLPDD